VSFLLELPVVRVRSTLPGLATLPWVLIRNTQNSNAMEISCMYSNFANCVISYLHYVGGYIRNSYAKFGRKWIEICWPGARLCKWRPVTSYASVHYMWNTITLYTNPATYDASVATVRVSIILMVASTASKCIARRGLILNRLTYYLTGRMLYNSFEMCKASSLAAMYICI